MNSRSQISLIVISWWLLLAVIGNAEGKFCKCEDYSCKCCEHFDIPSLKLNETGCLVATYLPATKSINWMLEYNDEIIVNQTISLNNPPPTCFVGLFGHSAFCIDMYNIKFEEKYGYCTKIEAFIYRKKVYSFDFGCFYYEPHTRLHASTLRNLLVGLEKIHLKGNRIDKWSKPEDQNIE